MKGRETFTRPGLQTVLLQGGRWGGKEGLNRIRQTLQEPFIHFTAHGWGLFFPLLQHLQEPQCFSSCWRNEAKSLFWCKSPWLHPAIHSMDNFIFSESSPGWLSDTEKWNSMALAVKCCSSCGEEQPTWTLPATELLQLSSLEECRQICPVQVFHWHCCLESTPAQRSEGKISLLPCQGNSVFSSTLLNQGGEDPPKLSFHIMFSKPAWGRKIRIGHTKSHSDLKPFWVYKVFPKLSCISSPDTCIEMYCMW